MSVGYLADSFDLFNVRDLDLIAQASARCTRLVLGVFTDDLVEEFSGRRPVMPLFERMALLRHVRGVSDVVAHNSDLADSDENTEIFVAVDSLVTTSSDVTRLTPSRYSESAYLRSALASLPREVVA